MQNAAKEFRIDFYDEMNESHEVVFQSPSQITQITASA